MQRTLTQNNSMHLLFEHIAKTLNDAGLDMKKTLKPEVDIPWSKETVKEYIWRPIMKVQLRKDSTTKLTTKEVDEVFNTINKHFGEKFGINFEFPSVESLMYANM